LFYQKALTIKEIPGSFHARFVRETRETRGVISTPFGSPPVCDTSAMTNQGASEQSEWFSWIKGITPSSSLDTPDPGCGRSRTGLGVVCRIRAADGVGINLLHRLRAFQPRGVGQIAQESSRFGKLQSGQTRGLLVA